MSSGQKPIAGHARHALLQRQAGFYSAFVPPDYESRPDRFYPVCVLLHDYDSSEDDLAQAALSYLPRDQVIYIAPRAPYPSHSALGQYRVWPATFQQWNEPGFPRDDLHKLRTPHLFTDSLAGCIANVRERYRTDNERVLVLGHGEGATYAQIFAYHHPELIRGYFAYAGGPYDMLDSAKLAQVLKKHGIVPFIAHCMKDPKCPAPNSLKLVEALTRLEVEHRTLFPEQATHDLVPLVLNAASTFFNRSFGA